MLQCLRRACMLEVSREEHTWYEPASHRLQLATPSVVAYEPGRHSAQELALELPGIGLAVPAIQSWQSLLELLPSFGL